MGWASLNTRKALPPADRSGTENSFVRSGLCDLPGRPTLAGNALRLLEPVHSLIPYLIITKALGCTPRPLACACVHVKESHESWYASPA